jgi:hypothetical protein
MTTGHNLDNLYDPVLAQFEAFSIDTGFSLSSWGDSTGNSNTNNDNSKSSDNNTEDETVSSEEDEDALWACRRSQPAQDENQDETTSNGQAAAAASPHSPTGRAALPSCRINSRVRFSAREPEIRCYEQVDRQYFGILFYSCHELQIIMDEARKEANSSDDE